MRTHDPSIASQKPVANSQKPEDQKQGQEQGAVPAPPATRPPRGKRLPTDWELPATWGEWAAAERPEWDERTVLRVSLKFRDYWLGTGKPRSDWEATWRNWVRQENARSPAANEREPTLAERRAATLDAITGRTKGHERDLQGTATRVDSATVHPLAIPVREPDGPDVGTGGPGGFEVGVG